MAYSQVDVEFQVKEFIGDGSTITFITNDTIIVNNTDIDIGGVQIGVTVNNIPKYPNVSGTDRDYSYNGSGVVFNVAPNNGDKIRVIRNQSKSFAIDVWNDSQTWTEGQYVIDISHDIYIAVADVPLSEPLSNPTY